VGSTVFWWIRRICVLVGVGGEVEVEELGVRRMGMMPYERSLISGFEAVIFGACVVGKRWGKERCWVVF
jgi:hypothetical protein